MVVNLDIKNIFYCFFDVLNTWVTKFFDFPGIGEYDMIVLAIKIRFFVVRLIGTSKLMFANQSALE